MSTFQTIVVAIDFSETSQEALRVACEIARDGASELHVVHVVADVRQQPWAVEAPGTSFHDLQQEWVDGAEVRLAGLAKTPMAAHVIRKAIIGAPVASALTQYAAEQRADLIVIGTHGYGPVRRFLLGSVSDHLLRSARCPVLTVPPSSLRTATEPLATATVSRASA